MSKSIRDWLAEGEVLYTAALGEYRDLEQKLAAMEESLNAKRGEVNQIALVIGKPPLESSKKLTAELVEATTVPASPLGAMARALTGRGGRA